MMIKLYDLAFEIDGDNIDLEQDMGSGDVARVTLHRIHLRHLAEQAGLIPAGAHGSPDAVIARLSRQLRLLYDRIDRLDDYLIRAAEKGHKDLAEECTFSFATWELAHEFVRDLPAEGAGPAAGNGTGPAAVEPDRGGGEQLPLPGALS